MSCRQFRPPAAPEHSLPVLFRLFDRNRVAHGVQCRSPFAEQIRGELNFLVAEQGLPESTAPDEILVLFPNNFTGTRQLTHLLCDLRSEFLIVQFIRAGLPEKLQTMALRLGHEFIKIKGTVNLAQVIVKEGLVRVFEQTFELRLNGSHVIVRFYFGSSEELQESACLAGDVSRVFKSRGVESHHAANKVPQMVPGISIVADIGYTLRVKHLPANCQHVLTNSWRNPGIETMGDNEVEVAEVRRVRRHQINRMQADVLQPKLGNHAVSQGNRTLRKIQPNKIAGRQMERHRNEV